MNEYIRIYHSQYRRRQLLNFSCIMQACGHLLPTLYDADNTLPHEDTNLGTQCHARGLIYRHVLQRDVPLSVNASIVAVLLSQSNCVSREHCSRFGVDNLQISIGHIHNFNKTQLYANNCRGGITKKTGFLSLSLSLSCATNISFSSTGLP